MRFGVRHLDSNPGSKTYSLLWSQKNQPRWASVFMPVTQARCTYLRGLSWQLGWQKEDSLMLSRCLVSRRKHNVGQPSPCAAWETPGVLEALVGCLWPQNSFHFNTKTLVPLSTSLQQSSPQATAHEVPYQTERRSGYQNPVAFH